MRLFLASFASLSIRLSQSRTVRSDTLRIAASCFFLASRSFFTSHSTHPGQQAFGMACMADRCCDLSNKPISWLMGLASPRTSAALRTCETYGCDRPIFSAYSDRPPFSASCKFAVGRGFPPPVLVPWRFFAAPVCNRRKWLSTFPLVATPASKVATNPPNNRRPGNGNIGFENYHHARRGHGSNLLRHPWRAFTAFPITNIGSMDSMVGTVVSPLPANLH